MDNIISATDRDTSVGISRAMSIGRITQAPAFQQLGVLSNDGSSSMNEPGNGNLTKAQSVNIAVREFMGRMKASRLAANYKLAVVSFDNQASVVLPPTQVGPDLDDNGDYDPLKGHGGGTRIYEGLLKADEMGAKFLAEEAEGGLARSTVYILMTDGQCNEPDKTREVARRIKERGGGRITIAAALFRTLTNRENAADDGAALLREIVTDPVMGFKSVYDAQSLRDFFIFSLSVGGKRD